MGSLTLRPYQKLIANHIVAHPRCAIWAGMGMGKTSATLYALNVLLRLGEIKKALVIAPLRVAQSTWPDEVRKWEEFKDLRVSVLTGTRKKREEALRKEADIYCINYESLPWLIFELDGRWDFDVIVADESTKLKSYRSKQGGQRSGALATVAFRSDYFIELTGTPASNGLLDLWGQFWFLDKGALLGESMTAYRSRYFYPIKVGPHPAANKWLPMKDAEPEILEKTKVYAMKLNPEDWFSIEEPIVVEIPVRLTDKQMDQYREFERTLWLDLENESINAANAAVLTNKCLQYASGAIYGEDGEVNHIHDAKLDALSSIVEESGGMPILVAYQFKHEVERILKKFPQARKLDKNPKTIREWNEGKIPILLAHPASCGHGLSLQDGGNILVFYSTGWNLEEHEQIIERIGPTRQAQSGHPRSVFVYNLVVKDTLDEVVQARITTKREVLDLLLEKKKCLGRS